MNTERLLEEVKAEIVRLQQVVALLEGSAALPKRRGRGKGKRTLSAAARRKISIAQKARWAKVKKAA
jgi:hypothetical protein